MTEIYIVHTGLTVRITKALATRVSGASWWDKQNHRHTMVSANQQAFTEFTEAHAHAIKRADMRLEYAREQLQKEARARATIEAMAPDTVPLADAYGFKLDPGIRPVVEG